MQQPSSSKEMRGPKRSVRFDGGRLRKARLEADRTQEDLAGIAGISVDGVRRAERGDAISYETAWAICAALEIGIDDYRLLADAVSDNRIGISMTSLAAAPSANEQQRPLHSEVRAPTIRMSPEDKADILAAIARRYGVDPAILEPVFAYLEIHGLTHEDMCKRAQEAIEGVLKRAHLKDRLDTLLQESERDHRTLTPLPIPELQGVLDAMVRDRNLYGAASFAVANFEGARIYQYPVEQTLQYQIIAAGVARQTGDFQFASRMLYDAGSIIKSRRELTPLLPLALNAQALLEAEIGHKEVASELFSEAYILLTSQGPSGLEARNTVAKNYEVCLGRVPPFIVNGPRGRIRS